MIYPFADALIAWQRVSGRHHLPWQQKRCAYRVWVSEIMLQQTQVTTVIGYYERFIERFPTIYSLAEADEDVVFQYWAGLGYYQRARNLHRTSRIIVQQYNGIFPLTPDQLVTLPGIGQSTAHAICSLVANLPYPILDANAKRVIMRYHNIIEDPNQSAIKKRLWQHAADLMPSDHCATYTQAIMDLGAQICKKKPSCDICPVQSHCQSYQADTMHLIPKKRLRKPKPERTAYFIWYRYQQQYFFIKRPKTGIWGNLWCPIETHTVPDIPHLSLQHLARKTHTFTHFILHIQPVIIETSTKIQDEAGAYFSVAAIQELALPAPIHQLMSTHTW